MESERRKKNEDTGGGGRFDVLLDRESEHRSRGRVNGE
jgi:hypothetical protein